MIPFSGIVKSIIVFTFGFIIWHMSAIYTSAKYEKEKLNTAEQIIEEHIANEDLKAQIVEKYQKQLAEAKKQTPIINKEIQYEIVKEPVYSDCKSTSDVVRNYERKLDLQTK